MAKTATIKEIPLGVSIIRKEIKKVLWVLEFDINIEYKLIKKKCDGEKYYCTLKGKDQTLKLVFSEEEHLNYRVYEDYKEILYYYKHANFSKDNREYVKNFYKNYIYKKAKDLEPGKDCIPVTLSGTTIYFDVEKKSEQLYDGCLKLNVHRAGSVTYGTEGSVIYIDPDRNYSVIRASYLFNEKQEERMIDNY